MTNIIKEKKGKIILGVVLCCFLIGFFASFLINHLEKQTVLAEEKAKRAELDNLHTKIVEEITLLNQKRVRFDPRLNSGNLATKEQVENRAYWTIKYTEKFNHMYEDIDHFFSAKLLTAIIGRETSWVNYSSLDNGLSTGVVSMRFDTAKEIADKLNEPFTKEKFSNDVEKQIKYASYYLYEQLERFEGDYHSAIIAYNRGPYGFQKSSLRYENYFFNVLGRLEYLKQNII